MDIKPFAAENIVTASYGKEVDPGTVNKSEYSVMTLDIIDDFGFSF